MKNNERTENEASGFFMIPVERISRIESLLIEINQSIQNKLPDENKMLDYVDEKQAIALLGRRATWFWTLRKEGKIKYSKVGSKVFYPKSEINRLLSEG